MKSLYSLNNRLIVEPYKKEGLTSTINNGFAKPDQKVAVKGLTVLMETKLTDGRIIKKGDKVYIKEESLYSLPWAQKILKCDCIDGNFLIVDITNVEFISSEET